MASPENELYMALLGGVCEAARLALEADGASVALLDETGADLVFVAVAGEGAHWLVGGRFPANEGIAGHVLDTGEPVEAADVSGDPRAAREVAIATGYSPNTMAVVPLRDGDRVAGVLSVLDARIAAPNDRRARLSALAKHAELALRLGRELVGKS